ncbi:phage tail family protein [Sporosarcina sp. FA9]|uniref:phage tail family protein n=1 Tax=Sporosarcina sp. FA9 TaxID=3413030 RepID=UPI003F65E836
MIKLNFTNTRGQTIELYSSPFRLYKVEGLGDVEADIQMQKSPFQDGSTYTDALLMERYITLELKIEGKDEVELAVNRRLLSGTFNPKLGPGLLRYTDKGGSKEIMAVAEGVPSYPDGNTERGTWFQKALIFLVCPNPYWRSENEHVEQLVTFSGGLTFPLILPTIFGNQKSDAKSRIIVNDGDAPTPIEVTFEGPATSPIRIENETTGEFIEVAQNLAAGEKLWISTAFGRKKVEKISVDSTRTNAFNYIYIDPSGTGPSSTFFQLEPGNNLLTYSTGEDYEKAPVTIKFYPRYLAV